MIKYQYPGGIVVKSSIVWQKLNSYWLIGLLLLSCCLWQLTVSANDLYDYLTCDTWQETTGQLHIHYKTSDVWYEYTVNDQTYTNDRLYFFEVPLFLENDLYAWIREHRNRSSVTVYYNPHNPTRSVLNRELYYRGIVQLLLAGGYAGVVICGPILLWGSLAYWLWQNIFKRK